MAIQSVVRCVASLSLAAVLTGLTPIWAAAATHTVEAGTGGGNVFAPRTLAISRGDAIRWDAVSGSHDVTSRLTGYFQANGQLATNGEYTRTFKAAGSFGYFCKFHEFAGMTGTIKVPIRVTLASGLFTIRVASATSTGTRWRNRVQVRKPGSSTWQTIA